jgi:hypothetical protein
MLFRLILIVTTCVSMVSTFVPNIHAGGQNYSWFLALPYNSSIRFRMDVKLNTILISCLSGSLVVPDFDAIRGMNLPPPHSEYFNPWSPDGNPQSMPYRCVRVLVHMTPVSLADPFHPPGRRQPCAFFTAFHSGSIAHCFSYS